MVDFSSILPDLHGYVVKSEQIQLRLIRLAGTGAYGAVYVAHDISTPELDPRVFAVKCMLKFEPSTEYAALQTREIASLQSLASLPHITRLHHVIEEQYYVYLVMDFYDGGDLFSAITDRHSFAGNDFMVKNAFLQLLDAVQSCHERGIFHRDLKPENILCACGDTRLFLSDFGLSTKAAASDRFGCGSAFYMSPECVGSSEALAPYSPRESDVWSLGIILVNMLTSRNPWRIACATQDKGYAMYLCEGTDFLARLLPISKEAADVLARALDPNPSTRITIPELRQRVELMNSFFPTTSALSVAGEFLDGSSHPHNDSLILSEKTLKPPGSDNSSRTVVASVSLETRLSSAELAARSFIHQACLAFDDSEAEFKVALQLLPSASLTISDQAQGAGQHDPIDLGESKERQRRPRRFVLRAVRLRRTASNFVETIHKVASRV